jgi:hypothetical protein
MRISILAVALTLALAGCASVKVVGSQQTIKVGQSEVTVSGLDGYNALAVQAPDPNAPFIFVISNNIVVSEDPLYPAKTNGQVVIIWRLDASDSSPYSFPDDQAILFHAGENNPLPDGLSCAAVGQKKKSFICKYTAPASPKKWKYTVRVKNSSGTDPTPLDPWVHQN